MYFVTGEAKVDDEGGIHVLERQGTVISMMKLFCKVSVVHALEMTVLERLQSEHISFETKMI